MAPNGCSAHMDDIARWINTYIRRVRPDPSGAGSDPNGKSPSLHRIKPDSNRKSPSLHRIAPDPTKKGRPLAFTGCCDEHDLFYEQGGSSADRAFADGKLRECIAENLRKRQRSRWVQLHVPWLFWAAVRCGGWAYWGKE